MISYIIIAVVFLLLLVGIAQIIYETAKHLGLLALTCIILAPVSAMAPTWYLQGMDTSSNWSAILWVVCSVGSLALFVFLGIHFSDKFEPKR
jgi:urea transporter